jgi:hypothetical protein
MVVVIDRVLVAIICKWCQAFYFYYEYLSVEEGRLWYGDVFRNYFCYAATHYC